MKIIDRKILILSSDSPDDELIVTTVERALLALGVAKQTYTLKPLTPSSMKKDEVAKTTNQVLLICNTNFVAKRLLARLVIPHVTIAWYQEAPDKQDDITSHDSSLLNSASSDAATAQSTSRARPTRKSAVVARRMILHSLGLKDPLHQSKQPK